jgi:MoxR-like ATPase
MSPEERKMLYDINKKLTDFLNAYYYLNFPDKEILEKSLEVRENVNVTKDLDIKGKLSFASLKSPQATIAKPTGGANVDDEARTAINTIIDSLKNLKLTL